MRIKRNASSDQLWTIAQKATIGMGSGGKHGHNQYLALPNKFFDYIHAGLPQIAMNSREYIDLNRQFEVAVLIDDINPGRILTQ